MSLKSVYGSKLFRSAVAFFLLCAMLLPAFAVARAESTETGELTASCIVTLPERTASFAPRLTDGRYNSRISFEPGEALTVSLAAGAKGIYLAWHAAPENTTVDMLDASDTLLASLPASSDLLNEYFALPANCARVRVTGEKTFAVSELGVFDSETPQDELCIMQAQEAQPKVMLIASYPSAESYYFGSLLPYLSGEDAALVFLSGINRQTMQEAIAARYALGSRTQPIFGSFPYYPTALELKPLYSYIEKKDVNNWLIQLLRRYQPQTLITHSAEGEESIGQHRLTSVHVLAAVDLAADEKKDYLSEREFGVWQVGAVYQHLETGSDALYDTSAQLSAFGGESALSLAQSAYEYYSALRVTHAAVIDAPYFVQTYPQTVSQQQSAGDLMMLLSSLNSPAALPEYAQTPAPSETPEPEAEPQTQEQEQQEEAQTTLEELASAPKMPLYLGAGLVLIGFICLAVALAGNKKRGAKRALASAGIALGVLLLLGGGWLLYRSLATPAAQERAETTQAPVSQTPTPAATATPQAPAAEEPEHEVEDEAEDEAFAAHFRKESDPAEVVVFDEENGIYEYRNDVLAIEIRRFEQNSPPLAYYIAHIYMREIDSYRSGFGSVRINGRDTVDACVMARRYRAVLGMTGDNLLHSDYNRGMMLRDGRIFRAMTQVSLMALTEDLSMRIYNKKDVAMLNEIEAGTQDTFAFGPPLIMDGVLCADVDRDRVGRINPRAGLGLVEPGHFVAIVADGRLPHYSHGMMLSDFAKLFLQEGCVQAYNLDGGASATLVFMGEYINKRADNHYRPVPDQLLWGYSELVPGENEPYQMQGLVPQGWRKGE